MGVLSGGSVAGMGFGDTGKTVGAVEGESKTIWVGAHGTRGSHLQSFPASGSFPVILPKAARIHDKM